MSPFDLTDKVVAITGASSGFGSHFAQVLANAGAKVVLGARREEKLADKVAEIESAGGTASSVRAMRLASAFRRDSSSAQMVGWLNR